MDSEENSHTPPFHMKNKVIPLGETLYFELVLSKHLVEHVGPEEQSKVLHSKRAGRCLIAGHKKVFCGPLLLLLDALVP